MSKDYFDGDPKITIDENGSDMTFINGQPVMDAGLENAAMISLFTRKGWFGNDLFRDPNQKIGSDFELSTEQPITISALNDIRDAAEKSLQWMIDAQVASRVIASASNPSVNNLEVKVLIEPIGKDVMILVLTRKSLNWVYQKIDPAYLKV
jgi:phage gp46-like protein